MEGLLDKPCLLKATARQRGDVMGRQSCEISRLRLSHWKAIGVRTHPLCAGCCDFLHAEVVSFKTF